MWSSLETAMWWAKGPPHWTLPALTSTTSYHYSMSMVLPSATQGEPQTSRTFAMGMIRRTPCQGLKGRGIIGCGPWAGGATPQPCPDGHPAPGTCFPGARWNMNCSRRIQNIICERLLLLGAARTNTRTHAHTCKQGASKQESKQGKSASKQAGTFPSFPSRSLPSFRLHSFLRPLAPSVTSHHFSPPSQGGNRSSSKSIYTNSRFTAFTAAASIKY